MPVSSGTIANLACSILKAFDVEHIPNQTLPVADAWLENGATNVVVLLLDAMGSDNLIELLDKNGFFRRHVVLEYCSVFPPTTVAATASLDSGLYPNQHGRLGWTCYYEQLGKNVVAYTNKDDEGNPVADENAADKYTPYQSILEKIAREGYGAHRLAPFGKNCVTSIEDMGRRVRELCELPGRKYISCYWDQPDTIMHKSGSASLSAREVLRSLENAVEQWSGHLTDTLLFITADHGHLDARGDVITDYPDLVDCLLRLPSIEPRTLNFFTKPGRGEAFAAAFIEHFGADFTLFTREQVLSSHLFGPEPNHPLLPALLGDYVAVAQTERTIFNTHRQKEALIGVHAGGTQRERRIPLIALKS
jgi:hypothetical protein